MTDEKPSRHISLNLCAGVYTSGAVLRIGSAQVLETLAGHPGYAIFPLDVEQPMEFGALPAVRDPMGRMIVAAARVTGSRLVSSDDALSGLGVDRLWG